MSAQSTVAQDIANAVKARQQLNINIYGHTITVWYDTGIPVITITRLEDGEVFEELASDKKEINQELLIGFLSKLG